MFYARFETFRVHILSLNVLLWHVPEKQEDSFIPNFLIPTRHSTWHKWLFLTFLRPLSLWSWLQCAVLGFWILERCICVFLLSPLPSSLGKWRIIRKRLKEVNCWLQVQFTTFHTKLIQSAFTLRCYYLSIQCS